MAYISKEDVQEIREQLKTRFPAKEGWKLSIRIRHHSTVCVSFMEAPVDLALKDNRSFRVNEYYINEHYTGEVRKIFNDTKDIITFIKMHYDSNADDIGADHPGWNYHMDIEVGRWDIPFKMSA